MGQTNSKKIIHLNGTNLTIELLNEISRAPFGEIELKIAESARKKMDASRDFVIQTVEKEKPVYGINTGFGALSDKFIDKSDLSKLQNNLIRSHCTGVGEPFSPELTKAIMVLRANCLCSGHSGVNPELVELILTYYNKNILPYIPQKGSVGASGDLAPLSHLALTLMGEGEVFYNGKIESTEKVLKDAGLKSIKLGPKDGLALINGTAVMAALGSFALYDAKNLFKVADIAGGMSLDGLMGTSRAFDPRISKLKPHPGQLEVVENINNLLKGSEIIDAHHNCGKVQDPYSLRCIPQVHGACRQTLKHTWQVIETELNSVTDNPLIFLEGEDVISGGNFHGEALALAMDYLAMGVAELCNISERRVEKMMNPTFSELSPFLTPNSGLNSGFMIAHVTSAALTSENKYLCHPASVDSIPTSTDKEDHVSMGVTAGLKLQEVIKNATNCLAIELLCSANAIDFRRPLKTSPSLEKGYEAIRKDVPPLEEDRILYKDIKIVGELISSGKLVSEVESTGTKLL